MVEPEIAFAELADNATLAEALLKYIFKTVLNERADDIAFFEERIEKGVIDKLQGIVDCEFVRMDYTEAIRVLEQAKQKFEFPIHWGVDLQSEHERYISETHARKPVILMNYPKEIKAFYMRLNDDEKTVAAMDVLVPGIGEIVGGSQREERLEILDARMTQAKLDKEHYSWYRDLRRYGTVPHAGFGLGFERTVAYATGLSKPALECFDRWRGSILRPWKRINGFPLRRNHDLRVRAASRPRAPDANRLAPPCDRSCRSHG
jgi:asparaginyl-tRNA synthetase